MRSHGRGWAAVLSAMPRSANPRAGGGSGSRSQPEFRVGRPYFRIFSIQHLVGSSGTGGAMDRGIGARAAIKAGVLAFSWECWFHFSPWLWRAHWRCFFTVAIVGCCFLPRWPRGLEERGSCGGRHSVVFFHPLDFRISPPAGIHRFGDAVCALGRADASIPDIQASIRSLFTPAG